MRLSVLALVLFFFSQNSWANEAGLLGGSVFYAYVLKGQAHAFCPTFHTTISCRDSYLAPSIRDHFYHHTALDANNVTLTSFHQDRGPISKSSRFRNGQSRSSFNLWISSIFQRPLLKKGQNMITYVLKNNENIVKEGSFDVIVEEVPVRYCPDRDIHFSNDQQCQTINICAEYFKRVGSRCN